MTQALERTERKIYTVSELTRELKFVVENSFPAVWVEGEVSNFKHQFASGHWYFDLKDGSSLIHGVMWRDEAERVRFALEDGLAVVAFGRVGVYEPRGQYQLYVDLLEPRGLGALQLAFEQLKARLAKEGLFDPARKRPIPLLPERIGIVTSPTGAAIRDMLKILKQRFANVEVVIYPVRVQGEGAAQEIAQAIDDFNRWNNVDVLIAGRGGGSLEDLWAFNEEVVARAIFTSTIPVISAVGHEVDFTIADFVADVRAATPTDAAKRVIAEKATLLDRLAQARQRAAAAVQHGLALALERLTSAWASPAFRRPLRLVEEYQQQVDELVRSLAMRGGHLVAMKRAALEQALGKLEMLSPLAVLARGYSLTLGVTGGVLRRAEQVKVGDEVTTRLAQGAFVSRVLSTKGPGPLSQGAGHDG